MDSVEEEQETVILSCHLVPVWQEVVQDDNMDKFGHVLLGDMQDPDRDSVAMVARKHK